MMESAQRFVPKVHPVSRPVEPDDPMALHAIALAGDPEVMLHCLVQEYAWMGWDAEQILQLFQDPFYPALHDMAQRYGDAGIRDRVVALLRQLGTFRIRVTEREAPEPVEAAPELVQLGMPKRWNLPEAIVAATRATGCADISARAEGGSHAQG